MPANEGKPVLVTGATGRQGGAVLRHLLERGRPVRAYPPPGQPDRFIGVALEIAGSELTNPAAAEVFSRVLGRRVKFRRLPMPVVRVALGREFYQMFRWFNQGGFQADIAAMQRDYPQLRTLEDWLREEGWAGRRAVSIRRDKIGRSLQGTASPAAR